MRRLFTILGFVVLSVVAVTPCFAMGSFAGTSIPVSNFAGWAATLNAKPLVGDFNADGKTDVALTGPSGWNNLPVAFSKGDGTFNVTNAAAGTFPGWAATTNAKILVGDFNAAARGIQVPVGECTRPQTAESGRPAHRSARYSRFGHSPSVLLRPEGRIHRLTVVGHERAPRTATRTAIA